VKEHAGVQAEASRTIGDSQRNLRERVLDELRERILDGTYLPGERLTEERLADDFGVSRSPVREALRVVAVEGLVRLSPRRGAEVSTPDAQSASDLLQVRARLEPLAARLAAERATPADVAILRDLLERSRRATEAKDLDAVATLNTLLHMEVVRIADSHWLSAFSRRMYLHVQWIFRVSVDRRAPHSWSEHIMLVDAIESGDPDRAEAAAAHHVEAAWRAAGTDIIAED
jgi:DNA-binding GntR family transcriptional regulator